MRDEARSGARLITRKTKQRYATLLLSIIPVVMLSRCNYRPQPSSRLPAQALRSLENAPYLDVYRIVDGDFDMDLNQFDMVSVSGKQKAATIESIIRSIDDYDERDIHISPSYNPEFVVVARGGQEAVKLDLEYDPLAKIWLKLPGLKYTIIDNNGGSRDQLRALFD